MAPDIRFAWDTDRNTTTVLRVEISNGVVNGETAALTEGDDDFILENGFFIR
jgi:hypothetical protein